MESTYHLVAGLDIHKKTVVVVVLQKQSRSPRTFHTALWQYKSELESFEKLADDHVQPSSAERQEVFEIKRIQVSKGERIQFIRRVRRLGIAAFVAFGEQSDQHFHFFTALLHVAEIVNDQTFEGGQALDEAAQLQIALRHQ